MSNFLPRAWIFIDKNPFRETLMNTMSAATNSPAERFHQFTKAMLIECDLNIFISKHNSLTRLFSMLWLSDIPNTS